jgi:phage shock protein A
LLSNATCAATPSHPDFYENLRKYRDAAKDLASRSEVGLAADSVLADSVLAAAKSLEDTIAEAKSQVPVLRVYMVGGLYESNPVDSTVA